MGTILEFRSTDQQKDRRERPDAASGEIVIFPGVRIERHDVDLAHRVMDTAGRGGGLGGKPRPRKRL